jgi:hypothetical protein
LENLGLNIIQEERGEGSADEHTPPQPIAINKVSSFFHTPYHRSDNMSPSPDLLSNMYKLH